MHTNVGRERRLDFRRGYQVPELQANPDVLGTFGGALPAHGRSADTRVNGRLLLIALCVVLALTWLVARSELYTSGSDFGYVLGVVGGTMMLLLFLYPLRKRVRILHGWGATKYWFALHMLLGILGPVFILLHSTYRVGSINAGVALTCMLLVAGSGVIGRFIYTRIHHGLYGERARLRDLHAQLGLHSRQLEPVLRAAPAVAERLKAFEMLVLRQRGGMLFRAWRFVTLSLRVRWICRRCARELDIAYGRLAAEQHWRAHEIERRFAAGQALIETYAASVQRVAQFVTYEKLFSWWHVLHVPLVYMLVPSAIAHVVAVHIY
jgi:hypothetical protein